MKFVFEGVCEEVGFGVGLVDPVVVGVFQGRDGWGWGAVVEKLSVDVPPLLGVLG